MQTNINLYEPFKLKNVSDGIWQADGDIIKFMRMAFSIRMFIVQLDSKDFWLFSPIQPNPKLVEQVKQLVGDRKLLYIVYGNSIHHIYAEDWMKLFPEAKLGGTKELITKMDKNKRNLSFDFDINNENRMPWQDEIDHFLIDCNKFIEEVVFYHRKSKSLIITDIIQNHDVDCPGYNKKFIYRWVGISKTNGGGIPSDYKMGFKWPFGNKQKAKETLRKALVWEFDKILITHGLSITENARQYYTNFVDKL